MSLIVQLSRRGVHVFARESGVVGLEKWTEEVGVELQGLVEDVPNLKNKGYFWGAIKLSSRNTLQFPKLD